MLLRFSIQKSFVPMCIAFLTLMKPKALFLKLNQLLFLSNPLLKQHSSHQNESQQHFIEELTCLGESGGKCFSVFLQKTKSLISSPVIQSKPLLGEQKLRLWRSFCSVTDAPVSSGAFPNLPVGSKVGVKLQGGANHSVQESV